MSAMLELDLHNQQAHKDTVTAIALLLDPDDDALHTIVGKQIGPGVRASSCDDSCKLFYI
jgi:hypothetical protein